MSGFKHNLGESISVCTSFKYWKLLQKKIPYQLTAKNAGGTNSTAFQVTGNGSKATVLSVPVRYLHSPSSICKIKDIKNTISLLVEIVTKINTFKNVG